jgi:hypothetical protein
VTVRVASFGVVALLALGACSGRGAAPAKRATEPAGAPTTRVAPTGRLVTWVGAVRKGWWLTRRPGWSRSHCARGRLALVDGRIGRVTGTMALPGSARHAVLAAAGGPVQAPVEDRGVLGRVGLPAATMLARTIVGRGAHDAAAWAGRVFVSDEAAAALSVLQDGRVVATITGPQQPGGVAAGDGRVDVRSGLLYVYDPATLGLVDREPAGAGPTHVVVAGSADGMLQILTPDSP